jgi:hypothetical protein
MAVLDGQAAIESEVATDCGRGSGPHGGASGSPVDCWTAIAAR